MPRDYDADEVDRRFAALIADQFGQHPDLRSGGTEPVPPDATPPTTPTRGRVETSSPIAFSFDHAMADADPTPEEIHYVPEPLPPLRMRLWQRAGWALFGVGAVLGLLFAFGAPVPGGFGWVPILAMVGGLAVLLGGLVLGPDRDDDHWDPGNGARL